MQSLIFILKAAGLSSFLSIVVGLLLGIVYQFFKPPHPKQIFQAWLIYSVIAFLIGLGTSLATSVLMVCGQNFNLLNVTTIAVSVSFVAVLFIMIWFKAKI